MLKRLLCGKGFSALGARLLVLPWLSERIVYRARYQGIKFPDTPLIFACFDLGLTHDFHCEMWGAER